MFKFLTFLLVFFFSYSATAQCGYQLVWEDTFDGAALDLSKWSYQIGGGGWGNNELQNYTNSNATVQNGILQITAKEPSPGNYTSSRIRSIYQGDFRYGKIEARIKLPEGQGIWPAFWMMPTCNVYGTWPASGEIDIMEYLGHQTNKTHGTCHFGNSPTDKSQIGNSYTLPTGDFANNFHNFSVEWSENNIKWFVDNILILEVNDGQVGNYNWPFNEYFHMILNVAVGGSWPGDPDATTVFPQVMEVDYVRVYQLIEDIEITGSNSPMPNATNEKYSVPDIQGATYDWYVPTCCTLISGQNTSEIVVDWATDSGEIEVVIGLPCHTMLRSTAVDLSNNFWSNGGFEEGFKGWSSHFYNGAYGSFTLDQNAPYLGNQNVCLTVNGLGNNFWDVQYRHSDIPVINGQNYMLSFYAKADQNNRHIRIDFRDVSNNNSTDNVHFYLTNQWTLYQYSYTAPYTMANLAVDFNHGFELGTFCYDEVQLEQTNISIGNCPDNYCVSQLILNNTGIDNGFYNASQIIQSTSMISGGQSLEYKAGDCIELNSGFEVDANTNFEADIAPCISN